MFLAARKPMGAAYVPLKTSDRTRCSRTVACQGPGPEPQPESEPEPEPETGSLAWRLEASRVAQCERKVFALDRV